MSPQQAEGDWRSDAVCLGLGCHNKMSQTGWLNDNWFLPSWRLRSAKPRAGAFSVESLSIDKIQRYSVLGSLCEK